jgi:beta-N-acetylhexosaminidase
MQERTARGRRTTAARSAALASVAAGLVLGCSGPAGPGPATTTSPTGASRSSTASAPPTSAAPSPVCTGIDLSTWTVRQLAARVLVAPVDVDDLGTAQKLAGLGVGGILVFGGEVPGDLRAQLAAVQRTADVPVLVMVDEEGGSVQRLEEVVGDLPSARTMAATLSPAEIEDLAERVGRDLAAVGVTVDLAPVLDLDDRPGPSRTNPDGSRSFSVDPVTASAAGLAFARGLQDGGIVPVVKHFPGLGYSTGNTDDELASTLPWPQLQRSGLRPFEDAVDAGIPAVMVANALIPGLTDAPASLSPEVIGGVLRDRLGFDGVVITDSLSARGIADAGYPLPKAAVAALAAGADLVLFGGGGQSDAPELTAKLRRAIVLAVQAGELSRERLEDSVARVLRLGGREACPRP